jgi:lambda repressor-like predicted transcriptional regulator
MAKTYMEKSWEQITDKTDREMSELIGILKNQGMDLLTISNLIKQELETDTLENVLSKYQVGSN